jgi:hypothetical protein
VVVHLEVATETATLDDGLPVATSTAEQLACDSRVRALITRQGNPLYLGRSHRTVSTTQLAALHIRDRHRCQFPGCDHQRFLHAHHIVHWLHGGPTDLDNLTLLCGFHHRLLHTHRYGARRDGRVLRVWRPTGEQVTAQHPPPNIGETLSATDLLIEHDVRTDAIVPSWTGERLDLDAVLATLFPEPHTCAA